MNDQTYFFVGEFTLPLHTLEAMRYADFVDYDNNRMTRDARQLHRYISHFIANDEMCQGNILLLFHDGKYLKVPIGSTNDFGYWFLSVIFNDFSYTSILLKG